MIRYNSTVRYGDPLSISAEALPNVKLSNVDAGLFAQAFPQYQSIVEGLFSMLPQKRFSAVTVMAEQIPEGRGTCMDTCWHLDGHLSKSNQDHYALICLGGEDVRTMFYMHQIEGLPIVSPDGIDARRRAFEEILGHDVHDERHGVVVPDAVPVAYTSLDFHKGRVALSQSRRILVRAMASDVIRPLKRKSVLLRK